MRKKKCGNKRLFYRSFFLVHPFSFLSFFQKKKKKKEGTRTHTHTHRKWLAGEAKEKERRKWKGRATKKRSRVESRENADSSSNPVSHFHFSHPPTIIPALRFFKRCVSFPSLSLSLSLSYIFIYFLKIVIILFYSILFQFLEWMEWWTLGLQGGNWVGEWWFPLLTTKVTQPPIPSGKGS